MGLAAIVAPLATGCRNDGVTIEASPGTGGAAGATNTGVAGAGIGAAGGGAAGGIDGSSVGGGNGVVTLRVVNVNLASGPTAGPLDIYDDMYDGRLQPSVSGTPIIADLAYGTVSSYVNPRFVDSGGTSVRLVALPAGSPPTDTADAEPFWSGIDNGSHPQLTILLDSHSPLNSAPGSFIAYTTYVEKGQDSLTGEMGPLAPPPPAGEGEYLVNTFPVDDAFDADPAGGYFFFVDDSCTPPLNGGLIMPGLPFVDTAGSLPPDAYAQFAAAPGAHSISIVARTNTATPACSDLLASKQATASVSLAAGQQILTILYGTSFTDLHLLAAPIAP
jgi:hypothetical protein